LTSVGNVSNFDTTTRKQQQQNKNSWAIKTKFLKKFEKNIKEAF